ncbi:hypothetical protein [uncultured Thiocystis sp.]|jgi:FMN phosphatase YigB (HAD superfamily)|uniref:HAD family hydrolase n=1 Tax=uncultured Thiocystis sp. TaxID=1202134 RepID=UPI0025D37992|nr:hypothetical protein [uncultured Thiocystis sp.]
MIYSFDVFDTLITRRVGTPRGVFVSVQRQLQADPRGLPAALIENFAEERVWAEHNARLEARAQTPSEVTHLPEEIDFADIHRWLAARHTLDAADMNRLMDMELEAEGRFLFGVPEMLGRFRDLARQGHRLVLLSDMYLRRQDLQRLLDRIDPCILECATLYLSSEIKLNKASGRLYAHVAAQEGVAISEIQHIGDNRHSDIQRALESGCQATLFDACHLTEDEWFEANEGDLGWQLSAGLFRECRLTLESNRSRLGALYAAPLLLPFVLWVAEQARAAGRRQVYFLARDGQVLLDIASKLGLDDLDLRYLHVSRLACHRCVTQDIDAFLDWVFVSHREMTIEDIAHRITAQPDLVIEYLQKIPGFDLPQEAPLNDRSKRRLRALFKSDSRLNKLILDLTAQERERVLKYLGKAGLVDGEGSCLVDIGWSGTIQDSLYEILRSDVVRTPFGLMGFYWGLQGSANGTREDNLKHAFAFQPGTFWRDPTALREIVECFTAADHGSTLGYREQADDCLPILNDEGREVMDWGLAEFRVGIDRFVDKAITSFSREDIVALMPYYFRRLEFLVRRPTELLAREIGHFPYSPDPTGKLLPFAPEVSGVEALRYHLSAGSKRGKITRWPEASIINSGPLVKVLMSSHLFRLSAILNMIHPRGFVDFLPYPIISWAKRRLPVPVIRAARAILRG